jgi:hypothetical protein
MNILNYFNSFYAKNASREQLRQAVNQNVRKSALTTDSASGGDLIPEWLRQAITNTAVTLVPELALPTHIYDAGKRYQFNRLTKLPAPGSGMGEMATTPTTSSVTARDYVDLKVARRKGAVSGFMKSTGKKFIDPVVYEMENQLTAFGQDLRTYMLYGNAGADTYTPWGVFNFISSNRVNLSGSDQVQTNLKLLDDMIDNSTVYGGKDHKKCFLISPNLLSALSRLMTTIRDNRTLAEGHSSPLVSGGWIMDAYRKVPFVETTATRPLYKTGTTEFMGTVTLGSAGVGGAIPNNTYYFRVAPVTWRGEQIASASNNSIATVGKDTITLSFTDVTDADGTSVALYYKVYCATTKDQEKLVKIVSAYTYDGNGTQGAKITSITFTSNPATADSTTVPTHMQSDLPLDRNGTSHEPAEVLTLWDLDEVQGLGSMPYTNEAGSRLEGLVTMEDIAKIDDYIPFMLKCYFAMADSWEKTSYFVKGIRTE